MGSPRSILAAQLGLKRAEGDPQCPRMYLALGSHG